MKNKNEKKNSKIIKQKYWEKKQNKIKQNKTVTKKVNQNSWKRYYQTNNNSFQYFFFSYNYY